MPKITYVSADGETRVVDGTVGDTVMNTAVHNGVPGIVGVCVDREPTSWLSCRLTLSEEVGDLRIATPEGQL